MDVSLEGKVALVTEAGPNIGSGGALALARYGAKVAVNDVSKESIDACLARIERNGGTAMAAPGDELLAQWKREGRTPFGLRPGAAGGLGAPEGTDEWRRPARFDGPRNPMVPMGTTGTPTDIGHAVAWLCSDYARPITGTDLVVDGGARAKNFAYIPAAPGELAGPLPLIMLDDTPLADGSGPF